MFNDKIALKHLKCNWVSKNFRKIIEGYELGLKRWKVKEGSMRRMIKPEGLTFFIFVCPSNFYVCL
jgi:hypothetical protein